MSPHLTMISTNHEPISSINTGGAKANPDSQSILISGSSEAASSPSLSPLKTDLLDCQPRTRETGNGGGQALLMFFRR